MKKVQAVVLALFAVFAFGAVLVSSASAETTLGAEWLANGAAITTNLASLTTGEILFEDTGATGSAAVLCSGILEGTVGAAGADMITKVLNLANEEISSTPLSGLALQECISEKTCGTPIEMWPVGLPWKSTLFTMENGEVLDLIEGYGYELLCFVFGIDVVDTCTAVDTELPVLNDPVTGDAEIPGGATATPLALCTVTNAETGVITQDELATITLVSGELLTVDAL